MNIWVPHSWGEMTLEEGFASEEDMKKFNEKESVVAEIVIEMVCKGGKWYWRRT